MLINCQDTTIVRHQPIGRPNGLVITLMKNLVISLIQLFAFEIPYHSLRSIRMPISTLLVTNGFKGDHFHF